MGRIGSLEALRGIFAMMIFLHHLGLFGAGGDAGVSFFIVLSGFVLSAGYGDRLRSGGLKPGEFLRRRLRRFWPLHVTGFVAALVAGGMALTAATPLIWGANLLMIQSWIPLERFYFSCDAPSWCLSDLVFCYAMFPFLCRRMREMSLRCRMLVATGLLMLYFTAVNVVPESLRVGLIYISPLFRLADFLLGMALWEMFNAVCGRVTAVGPRMVVLTAAESVAVALFVGAVAVSRDVAEKYVLASYWWLPVAVVIGLFALTERCGSGLIGRVLRFRLFLKFGSLSFAFYMLHVPVITAWRRICGHFSIDPLSWGPLPEVLLLGAVIIALSYAVDRLLSLISRP